MTKVRKMVERFPWLESVIHDLIGTNAEFDALCDEFNQVTDRLDTLDRRVAPRAMADGMELARRRAALEQQMLAIMSANLRV